MLSFATENVQHRKRMVSCTGSDAISFTRGDELIGAPIAIMLQVPDLHYTFPCNEAELTRSSTPQTSPGSSLIALQERLHFQASFSSSWG